MATTTVSRRKKKSLQAFTATCPAGLENLVVQEIVTSGGQHPESSAGAVSWQGDLETAYRLCLWSRFASRIFLHLAEFEAPDSDSLYRQTNAINWEEHFSADNTLAVFCTMVDSPIGHSKFAALRVKDAVVDQFRKRTGRRPNIDASRPDIRLNLHLQGTRATLSLDLSGESLHRRGYRTAGGIAPLKETLAAGIAQLCLSESGREITPDCCLLDPMCGSGTLLIEAAMIVGDIAPGLQRKSFGFMRWRLHKRSLWEHLVEDAVAREEKGAVRPWPLMLGYDADPKIVAVARKNIEQAGLDDRITIHQRQLATLRQPGGKGFILVNPPYGERLAEKEEVRYLYRCLGRIFTTEFPGWQIGFFTSNPDVADLPFIRWDKRYRLFNGAIKCRLLLGVSAEIEKPEKEPWRIHELKTSELNGDFANRLRKNCKLVFPWVARENISCFRIYDADIPEFNLAIDIYEEWVHVQEYAPPKDVEPQKARQRFQAALKIIRELLDIPHSRVFIKTRRKQKGKDQYQKRDSSGKLHEVREGNCFFLVNFTDYLDTGLFLDHRNTRAFIASQANGKKFLNLFAYTATATVFAASGGAWTTTSVDLSETYLARGRANLALNGYGGPQHQFVQTDCLQWLRQAKERYDLIFVDPPTFSNARHLKLVFDVQRDHEELLRLAMQRLNPDGLLIFSTNFRKFQLAKWIGTEFLIQETSEQTIGQDFKNKRVHRCWELRHRAG